MKSSAVVRPRLSAWTLSLPLLATSLAATVLLTPATAAAQAASAHTYAIPAGPLAPALHAFALEAGVLLGASAELTRGKSSAGLSGTFTPDEALGRLLAGSGLTFDRDAQGRYVLREASAAPRVLAPVQVMATLDPATEGSGSYAGSVATIGKGARSVLETPQSVSVLTRQRMDDQGMRTLADALGQTTGVTVQQAFDDQRFQYEARGFPITDIQADGVSSRGSTSDFGRAVPDLVIYDRVEVLRGANGLLQGAGDPSASVNMVRKRPLPVFGASAGVSVGSWRQRRVEGDISSPLNESGTVRARVAASWQDRDYPYAIATQRNRVVYGVVQADLTPALVLTLGGSAQKTNAVPNFWGLPAMADGTLLEDAHHLYLGAAWNRFDTTARDGFLELAHTAENGWRTVLAGNVTHGRTVLDYAAGYGALSSLSAPVSMRSWAYDATNDRQGWELYTHGPFSLLGREHEAQVGFNYQRSLARWDYRGQLGVTGQPFDTFDPALVPRPVAAGDYLNADRTDTEQSGVYGVLRLRPVDNVTVIAGGRLSRWRTRTTSTDLTTDRVTSTTGYRDAGFFTPYGGVVLALQPETSLYASVTSILKPQDAQTVDGQTLDPIKGMNYELGVKHELADGKAVASLAVFRVEQSNRAQRDPDYPDAIAPCCYLSSGKVRSQGVELEFSGELTPGWQLSAGYTYNTTRYVQDQANAGKAFNSHTPRHLLRVWSSYRLPGQWQAWTLGGGVTAQSRTWSENRNVTLAQGGYAVVGLMAAYRINANATLSVNVDNVFDRSYYGTITSTAYANFPGAPRNVMASLRWRY